MPHDALESDRPEVDSGLSRRGLLRGVAGLGAATVAAGMLVDALAPVAAAAPATPAEPAPGTPDIGEPMVAHVRDAATGEVDLFVGTRHIRFVDPNFTARLAHAAR